MRCVIQLSGDCMVKWLMLLMQDANSQCCSKEQKLPFSAKVLFLQQQVITLKDMFPLIKANKMNASKAGFHVHLSNVSFTALAVH